MPEWRCSIRANSVSRRSTTKIICFGIDLDKNSFAICGVDARDKVVLTKTLPRAGLLELFADRPSAIVAMEAGSGVHHWARELTALGHDARIIDPCLVALYRHRGDMGWRDTANSFHTASARSDRSQSIRILRGVEGAETAVVVQSQYRNRLTRFEIGVQGVTYLPWPPERLDR